MLGMWADGPYIWKPNVWGGTPGFIKLESDKFNPQMDYMSLLYILFDFSGVFKQQWLHQQTQVNYVLIIIK